MTAFSEFDWDPDDRYKSNEGFGPLMARILSMKDERVYLERWDPRKGGRAHSRFSLTFKYFTSQHCGWKRVRGTR